MIIHCLLIWVEQVNPHHEVRYIEPNNAEKALGGELAFFRNFPFESQQVSGP